MNFLLEHVIEGKIEGSIRRGRRRKQLLIDLTKKGRYLNFIEEALDRRFLRNHFGGECGPVTRQTASECCYACMNVYLECSNEVNKIQLLSIYEWCLV